MKDINYLLKDIKLNEKANGKYDYDFTGGGGIGDIQTVTGLESLENAIIFSLSTCFNELSTLYLYDNYGSKLYDLIKTNEKKGIIKQYIEASITKISRITSIQKLNIYQQSDNQVLVELTVDTEAGELSTNLTINSNIKLYLSLAIAGDNIFLTCKNEKGEPITNQYVLLIGYDEYEEEVTLGHCFINENTDIKPYLNVKDYTGQVKAVVTASEWNTYSSSNFIFLDKGLVNYTINIR